MCYIQNRYCAFVSIITYIGPLRANTLFEVGFVVWVSMRSSVDLHIKFSIFSVKTKYNSGKSSPSLTNIGGDGLIDAFSIVSKCV
jgi:hypothetical protein